MAATTELVKPPVTKAHIDWLQSIGHRFLAVAQELSSLGREILPGLNAAADTAEVLTGNAGLVGITDAVSSGVQLTLDAGAGKITTPGSGVQIGNTQHASGLNVVQQTKTN